MELFQGLSAGIDDAIVFGSGLSVFLLGLVVLGLIADWLEGRQ